MISIFMLYKIPKRKRTSIFQLWHACGAFKTFGFSRANFIKSKKKQREKVIETMIILLSALRRLLISMQKDLDYLLKRQRLLEFHERIYSLT